MLELIENNKLDLEEYFAITEDSALRKNKTTTHKGQGSTEEGGKEEKNNAQHPLSSHKIHT